jgi:hypothetical protein
LAKLSAIDIPYLAEILDRRRFGERQTSVVLAVVSLFSDVLVAEMKKPRRRHHRRRQIRRVDIGIPTRIP